MPLAQRQALGIAVMSYDGHLGFGLLADYDALPDLEDLAARPARGDRRAVARRRREHAAQGRQTQSTAKRAHGARASSNGRPDGQPARSS